MSPHPAGGAMYTITKAGHQGAKITWQDEDKSGQPGDGDGDGD